MTAVKVITVLGTSNDSWEDAARTAVEEASETIDDISGVEVIDWTADVQDGSVTEYKATVEIAFPVKHGAEGRSRRRGRSQSLLGRLLG